MALSLDTHVRIPEEVVFRVLEAESVVLNLESGIYFGLDDVGTRMWQLIDELQSLRGVADALAREYEAPREQLDSDLIAFVEQLHAKGLVAV